MVCATQYPESEGVGGHKKKSVAAKHFPMITSDKLSHARTVLRFAPEFVDAEQPADREDAGGA